MPFNVHPSYISDFMALKGECKIVCLTASTAPMAAVLDEHCDLLLVGDSLAMTIYGFDSTADMTLDHDPAWQACGLAGQNSACYR